MSHVVESMDFGRGPDGGKAFQAIGPEAPVAHAPDQQGGAICERREAAFDLVERLPRGLTATGRDVFDEAMHGAAVLPSVVRREVTGRDRGFKLVAAGERHPQRGPAEGVRALRGQSAQERCPTDADSPGDIRRRERARVEEDDSLQAFRRSLHRAQADGAAPILGYQRDVSQVKLFDQCAQIVDVVIQGEPVLRFVAQAAAEMVRRNAMKVGPQRGD